MNRRFLILPVLAAWLAVSPAAGPAAAFEFCSKSAEPAQVAHSQSPKRNRDAARETAGAETADALGQSRRQETRGVVVGHKGAIAEKDMPKAGKAAH